LITNKVGPNVFALTCENGDAVTLLTQ
jgi:hypothetical protein